MYTKEKKREPFQFPGSGSSSRARGYPEGGGVTGFKEKPGERSTGREKKRQIKT